MERASTIFYAIPGRSGVPEVVRQRFPTAADGGCFGLSGAFAAARPRANLTKPVGAIRGFPDIYTVPSACSDRQLLSSACWIPFLRI